MLHDGNGCVTFEGKGSTDITVMFKATPGSKRLQPLQRQQDHHPSAAATTGGQLFAAAVEDNYTVIFGSHRNSCLKASSFWFLIWHLACLIDENISCSVMIVTDPCPIAVTPGKLCKYHASMFRERFLCCKLHCQAPAALPGSSCTSISCNVHRSRLMHRPSTLCPKHHNSQTDCRFFWNAVDSL